MRYENVLKGLKLAIVVIGLLMSTACALTPVPVRLLQPDAQTAAEKKDLGKVALVVEDTRLGLVKAVNAIGVKRNGFWVPMAGVFLAHAEHLDKIAARSLSTILGNSGYRVVQTIPDVGSSDSQATMTEEEFKKANISASDIRDAGSQDEDKLEAELAALSAGKIQGATGINDGADAVVHVKIGEFYSDIVPFSGLLWPFMSCHTAFDVAVYKPGPGQRSVYWTKEVKSKGYSAWGLDNGESGYNSATNLAYHRALEQLEDAFRKAEFLDGVKTAIQSKD